MTELKIACLLPKRNNKIFYPKAFQSLCRQSIAYSDILICENYSSDGSLSDTFKLADGVDNAQVFVPENPARSVGESLQYLLLRKPSADYYHIASSDDIWTNHFLRHLSSFLVDRKDVAAIFCDRIYIDMNDRILGASGNSAIPRLLPQEVALRRFLGGNLYNIAGALFRSDIVENASSFAASTGDAVDWALIIEAARYGSVAYICKPLYRYRIHPQNTFQTSAYNPSASIESYLCEAGLYDYYKEIYDHRTCLPQKTWPEVVKKLLPYIKLVGHLSGAFAAVRSLKKLDRE